MFHRILVPYDTSKPADKALKYAVGLAESTASKRVIEMILIHVVPNIPSSPLFLDRPLKDREQGTIMLSEYVQQLYQGMLKRANDILEKKKKEIESKLESKAIVKTFAVIGDSVPDRIIEVAVKEEVDLIVIGNVGLSGISKLKSLGSVSRAVSERSPCPVLIAH